MDLSICLSSKKVVFLVIINLVKTVNMAGVNKVILVGNTGKDPEVRHLESGVSVASFPMATTETYRNKSGEKVSNTEWHNVVLWRGLAEIAERYIKKGTQLYIEGKIRTRSWDDKEGNKRYTTEIVGDVLQLLGRPGGSDDSSGEQKASGTKFDEIPNEPEPGDDLPF